MEQDWNFPNQGNVRGDLCSENGINALGSWCYRSNHPHAMESVVAIQGTNVVVQIVSSILDKLTRVARNVRLMRQYSVAYKSLYFFVRAAESNLVKSIDQET